MRDHYDVIVVGGGIGGLVSAALLADKGISTLLLEQHSAPGGCAATFSRNGYIFEAGATVGCGFHPGGPMDWLGRQLRLQWPVSRLPVAWEYLDGRLRLPLKDDQERLLELFPESGHFWQEQRSVAEALWRFTDLLLEQFCRQRTRQLPVIAAGLWRLLCSPAALRLAPKPALSWLRRHRLDKNPDFRRFLDAQLLISAQDTAARSNGLFAALALDLPHRHPSAIRGGVGTVASMLADAVRKQGGDVHLNERVTELCGPSGTVTEVRTKNNMYRCRQLVFNGSSAALAPLLLQQVPPSWAVVNRARWSAFVLHLGLADNMLAGCQSPFLQLLAPNARRLGECGSLFVSAAAADDRLSLTISTHTEPESWWQAHRLGRAHYDARKQHYTECVLDLLSHYLGDVRKQLKCCYSATPVTYARYTGRYQGLVGGYAQTAIRPPGQTAFDKKNLWLVGDHCFPGQSMAGVTVGAALTVDRLLRRL